MTRRRTAAALLALASLALVASASAASYRTAVVKRAGLHLQVPVGWAPVKLKKPAVFFVRDDAHGGTFHSNINIVVVPLTRAVTLQQYRQALLAELTGAGLKHVTANLVRLAAGEAVRTSYSAKVRSVTIQGTQVCFLRGLKSIVVTYTRARSKSKVAVIFSHSIASIRFGR